MGVGAEHDSVQDRDAVLRADFTDIHSIVAEILVSHIRVEVELDLGDQGNNLWNGSQVFLEFHFYIFKQYIIRDVEVSSSSPLPVRTKIWSLSDRNNHILVLWD